MILNKTFLATRSLLGGGGEDPFQVLFGHLVPHRIDAAWATWIESTFGLAVWNIQLFQVAAVLLTVCLFARTAGAIRGAGGGAISRIMAGWVAWIRDEMVYPNMQREHADKLLPLFLSLFFYVLFMNLFGLVPFGATATASVFVTGSLAALTLVLMLVGGIWVQGPIRFWTSLVPHGVPAWLVPLMFPLEVVGLFIKPFALMVRLGANMLGGHLVLLSFLGLALYFGTHFGSAVGLAIAPLSVGMSVFMLIIESFVSLLQAYVFTLLSVIFIGSCLHPDH